MSRRLFQTVHDRTSNPLHGKGFTVDNVNLFVIKFSQNPVQIPCNGLLILSGPDILYNSILIKWKCLPGCNNSTPLALAMCGICKLTDCKNFLPDVPLGNDQLCLRSIMTIFHPRCFRSFVALTSKDCLIHTDRADHFFKHIRSDCPRTQDHRRFYSHIKNR